MGRVIQVKPALFLLFFLCTFTLSFAFTVEPVDLLVNVYDANGHVVPDVHIIAEYTQFANNSIYVNNLSGTTDIGGQWETTIKFAENLTPTEYISLEAYAPYWSSGIIRARIPSSGQRKVFANFTIPYEFETSRVQVLDSSSKPLKGAKVQLMSPIFMEKGTGSNGIVFLRFPKGLPINGWVEYSGLKQEFKFSSQENQSSLPLVTIRVPFKNPKPTDSQGRFNWTVQIFDSNMKALSSVPFTVSQKDYSSKYISDSYGFIFFNDIPYAELNLSWLLYDYPYTKSFDVSANPPERIVSEQLLQIHPPSVIGLGESCYRIEINITDPRVGVLKQVIARAEDNNETLALSLDQNQSFNQTQITFYRIFCVSDDTNFDIVASSPYENASVKIRLLKSKYAPLPQTSGVEEVPVPPEVVERLEEEKKLEMIVILIEILVLLAVVYLILRFNKSALYFFQSIIRYLYSNLQSVFKKKH
ncbi:MAG: hypothetical protein WC492_01350 [Candidatus Micrarchaeia archaeon]